MVKHGNINKAGKVKNSTPKVEPKDKHKPPVGRAKKRLLYQKRWVNQPTTGKKKGPNAQKLPQ
jgi:small subunit ribosomal protein S30e